MMLHGGSGAFSWGDAALGVPLLGFAAVYAAGAAVVGRRRGTLTMTAGTAYFVAGWITLLFALASPLHRVSERVFTAHMIQHELLMVVSAPLLVLARPAAVLLRGLPAVARRIVVARLRSRQWRRVFHVVADPFNAWFLHAVTIWAWHAPPVYQSALRVGALHALQHLSFIATALLFWWSVLHPRRRASLGLSIVLLFTTAVHTSALGALLTFSSRVWYPAYAISGAQWHLTPIQDQQLAGLTMWIPASVAYLLVALVVTRRWLQTAGASIPARTRYASSGAPHFDPERRRVSAK